jgi:type VI protein secretion system component VasA
MEMCVIACRYHAASTMVIVEKGDDVHGIIDHLAPHAYATLPSIASVKLTVDYGTVGYHAGRFHNGTRYLVDPIRAFLKHFTRLSDSNVSNAELYNSYISRATDYSDAEVDFLLVACQQHYPHYAADAIATMISVMISLRRRSTFEKYSKLKLKPFAISVDTERDCVENCLRLMYPRWPKNKIRQFRRLERHELVHLLREEGVPYKLVDGPFDRIDSNILYISEFHARVKVTAGL